MNARPCCRSKDLPHVKLRLAALLALTLLGACRHTGDLTAENGGGVYAVRSTCPIAGIPTGTGDITLFNPPGSTRFAGDRRDCGDHRGARDLPGRGATKWFRPSPSPSPRSAAMPARRGRSFCPISTSRCSGGATIAAKQVGRRSLNFPAGSQHAMTRAQASVRVNRGAATLPANVRTILTRPRKAGEAEAAVDPLSDPAVRTAVANATFEHLVGFQLTQDQLKYNATR